MLLKKMAVLSANMGFESTSISEGEHMRTPLR